jgi:hypothetical protein
VRRRLPRHPGARAALAVVALLVAVNVLALAADAVSPSPGGRPSSSLATQEEGLAAWAALLEHREVDVRRVGEPPSEVELPRDGTLVLLDPGRLHADDAEALGDHVRSGGRLVIGGRRPQDWLEELLDEDAGIRWTDAGAARRRPLLPAPEVAEVTEVVTAGAGSWRQAGRALPVLDDLLLVTRPGGGRLVLLADPSPVQNRLLGEADNAALALGLAGDGPVTFLEHAHGYGPATGLAALPDRVQWALALLAAAALAFILARGRRLGPPEPAGRPLPPPRRAYVDALGTVLARTGEREAALATVRDTVRERLGVGPRGDVDAAARAAGLTEEEQAALRGPLREDDEVLALGRALARVRRGGADGP